jgi:hypothetical protein
VARDTATIVDQRARAPLPCPPHTVVTDGHRLATVLSFDAAGRYHLEDASTTLGRDAHGRLQVLERVFPVLPAQLALYRVVRWPAPDVVLGTA